MNREALLLVGILIPVLIIGVIVLNSEEPTPETPEEYGTSGDIPSEPPVTEEEPDEPAPDTPIIEEPAALFQDSQLVGQERGADRDPETLQPRDDWLVLTR